MPHTIDITGPNGEAYSYELPGSWAELSAEKLAVVASALASGKEGAQVRMQLFKELAGIPTKVFRRISIQLSVLHGQEGGFLPQLDWVFTTPFFDISYMPSITLGKSKWTGPGNTLGNFSVLQLSFADICLGAVAASPTDSAVHDLLGALYYEDGAKWDHSGIEQRGKALAALPHSLKMAAILNYRGLRSTLPTIYPLTFSGKEEEHDFGIDGLLEGLAGDKFGTVDEVGSKPLHPVLVHCERMRIREREMKAQAPAA
jgi:hypothetical protein